MKICCKGIIKNSLNKKHIQLFSNVNIIFNIMHNIIMFVKYLKLLKIIIISKYILKKLK